MNQEIQGELVLAAHARHTDPSTSHAAAKSLPSDTLRRSQMAVLSVLCDCGPMDDKHLVREYPWHPVFKTLPQSDSGLRTRRKELVAQGLVEDSGMKVESSSGRQMIVWQATGKGITRHKGGA
jgi:hypothetical protein